MTSQYEGRMIHLENKLDTPGFGCLVVEVDIESWIKRPAVTSRPEIYLIQGNKVIGAMRVGASRSFPGAVYGLYETVMVQPDDEATREFFKDDIGWIEGHLYGLRYHGVTGDPFIQNDEDEGRHKDTRVVDKFEFDFGICHPSFKDVDGFDSYHKQPKPRHRVKQKSRRPRCSNKIKKVR